MNAISPVEVDRQDLVEAVREAALLADVTISVWGAERTDAAATQRMKADAGAVGTVGRFIKNMLAGADGKLKDCRSAFSAVRSIHYGITLPFVTDPHAERQRGPRLLPKLLFERYLTEISLQKREAMAALDEFIAEYPDLITRAKANLGDLADASYPSPDEVRSQFRVSFDIEPIPASGGFSGLPDHFIKRLSLGLHRKQERMIETAQRAMWEQARERVQHIMERMRDPDAKFKVSTVEAVRELVTLLPGWGIADSERANEIAADIERMLSGVDVEDMRKDARVRATVATDAQAVVDKLNAWNL